MDDDNSVIPEAAPRYRLPMPPDAPRSLLCDCGAHAVCRVTAHPMATDCDYRCEEHAAQFLPPLDLVAETAAKCAEAVARLYGQVGIDLSALPKSERADQLLNLLFDTTGALHDLSGQLSSGYVKMVLEEVPAGWPMDEHSSGVESARPIEGEVLNET